MEKQMREAGSMTACGIFPDEVAADRAVVELLNAGFREDSIGVSMVDVERAQRLAENRGIKVTSHTQAIPAGTPPATAAGYQDRLANSGVLITVACGDQCQKAMDIINQNGAEMTACATMPEVGAPPVIIH